MKTDNIPKSFSTTRIRCFKILASGVIQLEYHVDNPILIIDYILPLERVVTLPSGQSLIQKSYVKALPIHADWYDDNTNYALLPEEFIFNGSPADIPFTSQTFGRSGNHYVEFALPDFLNTHLPEYSISKGYTRISSSARDVRGMLTYVHGNNQPNFRNLAVNFDDASA
jgi:hypothetical protein